MIVQPATPKASLHGYASAVADCLSAVHITDGAGNDGSVDLALDQVIQRAAATHARGYKLMLIGNGGSAAIASHAAIDFAKAAGWRAITLTDSSALTCLSNDLGYAQAFAYQVRLLGMPGDLLIAISSSGASPNILEAVKAARDGAIAIITLSGFDPANALRRSGDLNFYVPIHHYGMVELSHHILLHAVVDLNAGWRQP
jgi:D-sedoheptulose 7-phosphate isomerase